MARGELPVVWIQRDGDDLVAVLASEVAAARHEMRVAARVDVVQERDECRVGGEGADMDLGRGLPRDVDRLGERRSERPAALSGR